MAPEEVTNNPNISGASLVSSTQYQNNELSRTASTKSASTNPNSAGGSTSGERFKDIAEVFESQFGQCLQTRTDALGNYSALANHSHQWLGVGGIKGLGPPDLIHILKSSASSKNTLKEVSSYHHILGVDTSSSASIAAYINSLTYSLEHNLGWFKNNPWKISKGTFCCWNAFAGVDVRVEARIPGGVTSYAISPGGVRMQTTSELWVETFVSSMLRSIHLHELPLQALRKIDPVSSEALEHRLLDFASKIFVRGPLLGSAQGHPVGSISNNWLTMGIKKYFFEMGRPMEAANFFRSLEKRHPELNSPIAEALLLSDSQPEAIKLLCASAKLDPTNTAVLLQQIDFLLDRKRYAEAIELGKWTVRSSPMDHLTWIALARSHARNEEYSDALLALNNCPFSIPSDYMHDMFKVSPNSKIWNPKHANAIEDVVSYPTNPESILERMRGAALKGLLAQAYSVLTEILKAIEWEELLNERSKVFLMEEECRGTHAPSDTQEPRIQGDGPMVEVPLRVEISSQLQLTGPKPTSPKPNPMQLLNSNKRLCERWLDSLFMILFDDLRIYTIFRTEMNHAKAENGFYQRTPREWLLLGDLCARLGRIDEARDVYRHCVETLPPGHTCRMAFIQLTRIYTEEGRLAHALIAASKVVLYDFQHYLHSFYPSEIGGEIFKLAGREGVEKIRTALISLKFDPPIDAMIQKYLECIISKKCLGYDY